MDGLIAYALSKKYVDGKTSGLATGMSWKGTKENVSSLPQSGNQVGDLWHVNEDGNEYAWDGSKWEALGSGGSIDDMIETFDLSVYNNVWCQVQFSDKDYIKDTKYAGKPFVVKQGNRRAVCVSTKETVDDSGTKYILALVAGRIFRYKASLIPSGTYVFTDEYNYQMNPTLTKSTCEYYLPASEFNTNRLIPDATSEDFGVALTVGSNQNPVWKRAPVICLEPFDAESRGLLQQVTWSMIAPAAKAAADHKASYYVPLPIQMCGNFINYCNVGGEGYTDADRMVMIDFPDPGGGKVILKYNGSNAINVESLFGYASFSGVVAEVDTVPYTYRITTTWIADIGNNAGYVVITVEYESPTLLNM